MVYFSNYNSSLFPGLLPTPNSPILIHLDSSKYIKQSYYPIPYSASIGIEGYADNIERVTSWDINVSNKTVKLKIEWCVCDSSTNALKTIFPKDVTNSISTYNVNQPTWSTSYSTKK